MKGDFATTSHLAWGGVIFAGIIIATVFFFQIRYMDYMAVLKTPPEELKVIEVANSVKNCFLDGKYYATEEFLNRYEGKDLDEICGFKKPGAEADVIDMETGKMWKFDSKINEPEHSLWISIAFQDFEVVKDSTKGLRGEYVIHARWETGLGIVEANDVFIDVYTSGLYPKEPG
ncbi:MAG: hypothetical protein JSV39_01800 [Candidatus Aenigmatarchaeota archaeon]|nr:MAG: hypothetical protein JSV39_01800 [Candidatus Aenigmarchaeota archaeon]